MQAAVQDRMFEPFYTTKIRGTGVGLTVVQQLVAAHGGQIDVVSVPGTGTTITLRFALATPAAQQEAVLR
jgi:signal transduction histidine kinase